MNPVRTLFWFRRDLRLDDNAGLSRALEEARLREGSSACVFLFDRDILERLELADRRLPWIHASLSALGQSLRERGSRLLCLQGRPQDAWPRILDAFPHAVAVHCNHDQEPARLQRDREIEALCHARGLAFASHKDATVLERDELLKADGTPYRVYTPWRNAWRKRVLEQPSLLAPLASAQGLERLAPDAALPEGFAIPSLGDLGFQPAELPFPAGEAQTLRQWEAFKPRLEAYGADRDFPAREGTSNLAVALRFGTVSVRRLFRETLTESVKWSDELVWREFHHMLLWHFPHTATRAFRPEFEALEWDDPDTDPTARERLQAWQEGRTGYPAIDAPMRELAARGTMPNRLRMVVASFLTKDLHLHWRHGERWFARHLMDYDMAANVANWQWCASTGCDAQPWFRIFHPTTQGRTWDPDGTYVLRWCPELAGLSPRRIHEPWADPLFGPEGYPRPIVDHARERAVALERYGKAAGKEPA